MTPRSRFCILLATVNFPLDCLPDSTTDVYLDEPVAEEYLCAHGGSSHHRRDHLYGISSTTERVGHSDGGALVLTRYRHLYPSESYAAAPSLDALVAEGT